MRCSTKPSSLLLAVLLFAGTSTTNAQVYPSSAGNLTFQTFAKGLYHPWALAFLPDGRLLVTERPGRMRIVGKDGKLSPAVQGVPAVYANGQGGLLDVVLAPDFASSGMIFFSYAELRGQGKNGTTVARARLVSEGDGGRLDDVKVI